MACLEFPEALRRRLSLPLPGRAAQARFSPQLGFGRHFGPAPFDVRSAAVGIVLYPADSQWWIPLTVRPDYLPDHPGQICLPGGTIEPGETPEQAALREVEEELGIARELPQRLGRLSPLYVFASNYNVVPVVAALDARPRISPCPDEVAEVLLLSTQALLEEATAGEHEIRRGEIAFRAPHLLCDGRFVWGATAMILSELAEVIRTETNS